MTTSTPSRRDIPLRTRQAVTKPTGTPVKPAASTPTRPRRLRPKSPVKPGVETPVKVVREDKEEPRSIGRHGISVKELLCSPSLSPPPQIIDLTTPSTAVTVPPPKSAPSPMDVQPEAGPSRLAAVTPQLIPESKASVKGKQRAGKVLEKRVMPGRIRRAAGGGADGIRDLEEMLVDWLDRWGTVSTSPPDDLSIYLSTMPMSMIHPPASISTASKINKVPLTPSRTSQVPGPPPPSPRNSLATTALEKEKRIETPDWVLVKPGEDDAEEAKEELGAGVLGLGIKRGLSPLKRKIRHGHDENVEDTSDEYYHLLHRKYEVFERRQRIREKEKLQFERYKMKSRIDLLKGMSIPSWSSVVNAVLSRLSMSSSSDAVVADRPNKEEGNGMIPNDAVDGDDDVDLWGKGREKIKTEGVDWLRARLVKEGEEVLKRYDQLLPTESRKMTKTNDLRNSTPVSSTRSISGSPSLSPPPPEPAQIRPARVTALRETLPTKKRALPLSPSDLTEKPAKKPHKVRSEITPKARKVQPATVASGRSMRFRGGDGGGEIPSPALLQRKSTLRSTGPISTTQHLSSALGIQETLPGDFSPQGQNRRSSLRGVPLKRDALPTTNEATPKASIKTSFPTGQSSPVSESSEDELSSDDEYARQPLRGNANNPQVSPLLVSKPPITKQTNSSLLTPGTLADIRPHHPLAPPAKPNTPDLIVAAAHRENLIASEKEAEESKQVRPRTRRMSGQTIDSRPFGVPIPPTLEAKSDFNLIDYPEFYGLVAQREALHNPSRDGVNVDVTYTTLVGDAGQGPASALESLASDEASELEGVEAAVVI